MARISETVKVDILEKKEDGSFKHKLPSTSIEQVSGLDEKLESYATKDYVELTSENFNENIENQVLSLDNKINDKVDKESGKGLSTNDYTNVDKSKVDNIPSNPKYSDTIYDDTELKTRITAVENREDKDTTYNVVTTTTDGLMSSADKAKLVSVEQDLGKHLADDVLHGKIGTKEVDESGIADKATLSYSVELGKWVAKLPPDDLTGSPGSPYLLSGTMQEGFFGEVASSQLITGDALASQVGISQGASQHSTAGWLKFAYKGEIQFVAKKPIRHSISWDAINVAKCVYGGSGDKTITIDGLTYKVTLMKGANDKFNSKQPISGQTGVENGYRGELNYYSEWNRLMCQIHEQAINKSWDYPDAVESDIGILEHSLGNGNQGMYSDADLIMMSGNGRASWCQEMSTSTSHLLVRGYLGVSNSGSYTSSGASAYSGWRPVLRLIS